MQPQIYIQARSAHCSPLWNRSLEPEWWYTPAILALGRLKQEDSKFSEYLKTWMSHLLACLILPLGKNVLWFRSCWSVQHWYWNPKMSSDFQAENHCLDGHGSGFRYLRNSDQVLPLSEVAKQLNNRAARISQCLMHNKWSWWFSFLRGPKILYSRMKRTLSPGVRTVQWCPRAPWETLLNWACPLTLSWHCSWNTLFSLMLSSPRKTMDIK